MTKIYQVTMADGTVMYAAENADRAGDVEELARKVDRLTARLEKMDISGTLSVPGIGVFSFQTQKNAALNQLRSASVVLNALARHLSGKA